MKGESSTAGMRKKVRVIMVPCNAHVLHQQPAMPQPASGAGVEQGSEAAAKLP